MKTRTTLPVILVTTLTAWSLIACGAPAAEPAAMADKPAAEQTTAEPTTEPTIEPTALAETKAMTDTAALADTQAMSETKALTDTAAMTETHVMTESAAMDGAAMMMLHGSLVGLGDGQHEGAGDVEISGKAGAYTLKFTNFTSSAGPDLRVILSKNADPITEKVGADWLDLGALQSTSGDQEYALPAAADLAAYKSVVVYCVSFDFVFSAATLQ